MKFKKKIKEKALRKALSMGLSEHYKRMIQDSKKVLKNIEASENKTQSIAFLKGQSNIWRNEFAKKLKKARQTHQAKGYEEKADCLDKLSSELEKGKPSEKALEDFKKYLEVIEKEASLL